MGRPDTGDRACESHDPAVEQAAHIRCFKVTATKSDTGNIPQPAGGCPVQMRAAHGAGLKRLLDPGDVAGIRFRQDDAGVAAGADTPDAEIEAFIAAWDGTVPLVLVPTAYPQMTVERMKETGKVGLAIWGNHAIRAAVTAMQTVFAQIRADGGINKADGDIVPVAEIFRLQDMDGVKETEKKFLK